MVDGSAIAILQNCLYRIFVLIIKAIMTIFPHSYVDSMFVRDKIHHEILPHRLIPVHALSRREFIWGIKKEKKKHKQKTVAIAVHRYSLSQA